MRLPKITVVGDGGWGTTLAVLLARKKYPVSLWGAFPAYCAQVARARVNAKFLPGVRIPASVTVTGDLGDALAGAGLVVLAVPSQYMRAVLRRMRESGYDRHAPYVSVTKGIEIGSLKRMSEVIREELGGIRLAVVSGPTIAHELARGLPTTAVVAAHDAALAAQVQGVFMTDCFRIYTNDDVTGVELGGSLKNVIAIACGIADGLGFGSNAKAALLSRGVAEIARLGTALGAKVHTFSGLTGLGDLVTTCVSTHSRNRCLGEQIGRGKSLAQAVKATQMVAEGVPTAKSAYALARRHHVEMPITQEVYAVLYRGKSPRRAVTDLMRRDKKAE